MWFCLSRSLAHAVLIQMKGIFIYFCEIPWNVIIWNNWVGALKWTCNNSTFLRNLCFHFRANFCSYNTRNIEINGFCARFKQIYFQQWPHPIGARSHEIERHKNCTLLVGRNYNEFKYIYLNLFWSRKKSEAKLWWFILADEMLFVIYYSLMHRPSSRRIFDWTIFIVSRWFNAVQRVSICTWFGFLLVHIFAAHLFLLIM